MRRLFAYCLFALLVGVGLIVLIETDPGYVLVTYGNYTLESSLWVGLLALALGLWLFYQLLRLIYRLLGGKRSFVSWLDSRRAHQSHQSSTRGLINYIEGNWLRARRQLLRGVQNNDMPLMNYVLAARASVHLDEPESAAEYLQAASDAEPEAAIAVEIVRAEHKLQAGDYEHAIAVLEDASANVAKHPYVLQLLQRAYEGTGDLEKLLALQPELLKHKQTTTAAAQALELKVQQQRLQSAATATELHSVWQGLASQQKQDAKMLQLYVNRELALGDQEAAEKSILRALKRHWDPLLVRQLGLLEGGNASARLSKAERWLPDHPEDAQLLLCLGRLCLRDSLWGKARDYFESSYRIDPSAEVCAELGRLLVALGEPKVAAAYYREGLAASTPALPELPLPDRTPSGHLILENSSEA
jgi:HemY protein